MSLCDIELIKKPYLQYIREQKEFNDSSFDSLDAVDNQLGIALCDLHNEKLAISNMCNFDWINSAI